MIKINLAARRQSEASTSSGGGGKFALSDLLSRFNLQSMSGFPIKKVMIPLVTIIALNWGLDSYKEDEKAKLDTEIGKKTAEGKKLQTELGKMKDYEAIKKSLDSDEKILRTKLEIIQKLSQNRNDSVKMLYILSKQVPAKVWLKEYKFEKDLISIKGATEDFSQVTNFMKGLTESTNFADVDLKESKQNKDEKNGLSSDFELKAKWR